MTDIAELGFKVDTSGLASGAKALDDFKAKTDQTSGSFDKFSAAGKSAKSASDIYAASLSALQREMIALSGGLGLAGTALAAMGPAGLVAAAAFGAAKAAMGYLIQEAGRLADVASALRQVSETTGLATDQLQALESAGVSVGVTAQQVSQALELFSVQMVDLRRGAGPLYDELQRISPALVTQLALANSAAEAWDILAKAYQKADQSQQNLIARSAFGRGGIGTGRLLDFSASQGGVDQLNAAMNKTDQLTRQQIDDWDKLKKSIDDATSHAHDNLSAIFTPDVLQTEKQFAEIFLDLSRTAKDFTLSADLKYFALLIPTIGPLLAAYMALKGVANVVKPPVAAPSPSSFNVTGATGAVSGTIPGSASIPGQGFSNAGALDPDLIARKIRDEVSALGSAASAADVYRQKHADLDAQLARNTISLETYKRAIAGLGLDQAITITQAYVSALGPMASVADQVAAKMLSVAKAQEAGAPLTAAQIDGIRKLTEAQALGTLQIQTQADAYKVEAATVNMGAGAKAAYTLAQTRLNEAQRNGQPLTDAQKDAIMREAAAAGAAAQALAKMQVASQIDFDRKTAFLSADDVQIAQQLRGLYGNDVPAALNSTEAAAIRVNTAMKGINDAATSAIQTLISGLRSAKTPLEALSSALVSFSDSLAQMGLKKITLDITNGGGGIFGSLFSSKTDLQSTMAQSVAQGNKMTIDELRYGAMPAASSGISGIPAGAIGGSLAGIAALGGSFFGGMQSQSPIMGALSGGLSGALAGAVLGTTIFPGIGTALGALIGGVAGGGLGGLGGIFGQNSAQQQANQQRAANWQSMLPSVRQFEGQLLGQPQGTLGQSITQAEAQAKQIQASAKGAAPAEMAQIFKDLAQFKRDAKEAFRDTFGTMIDSLKGGFGMNSPAIQAANQITALGEQLRGFIKDTGIAGGNVGEARRAARSAALQTLDTPKQLDDVQTRLMQLHGTAEALKDVLEKLGLSSKEASKEINEHLKKAIDDLRKSTKESILAQYNQATGKGYLNDIIDAEKARNQSLKDAKALGINPKLINETFAATVQNIIDQAGLTGKAFDDLIKKFPQLAKLVHESTTAFDQITAYLDKLSLSDLSPLSPMDKLAQAQSQFNAQLRLAKGGDKDALSSITQYADTLLGIARDVFASSPDYVKIYQAIVAQLHGLVPGFAAGGLVTNGIYGVDSVTARLAGGEFINRAASVNAATMPALDYINRTGRVPGNDNGKEIMELLKATMRGHQMLADRLSSVEETIGSGLRRLNDTTRNAAERKPSRTAVQRSA